MFCHECGKEVSDKAIICSDCGTLLNRKIKQIDSDISNRDWTITLLLNLFGGLWGLHRFYTGFYLYGFFQLLTGGGFFIWAFIDLIILLTGKYKDADGKLIKNRLLHSGSNRNTLFDRNTGTIAGKKSIINTSIAICVCGNTCGSNSTRCSCVE